MLKTLTFTLMHFCIAFGIAYALTGSVATGGLVAVIEPLCNAQVFYVHKRIWQRLDRNSDKTAEASQHSWRHRHA
ncbi:DUF2061 domain-containing protein [Azorhizophilus paspali]|uniref:DUF2061 domain-containing protein n=1 Tax=Azorhizophilus paspali TaxID=69963 RepID=A0ABV6SI49_AZOPA